jgi:predicted Rossmann-fold nucleotide-binding protein
MMDAAFDREAARILKLLPPGPRIGIIGSTSFWHADSQLTCEALGEMLAGLPAIVVLTGGVEGVGETVGRSIDAASARQGYPSRVFHVLPRGESAWDYGQTFFAGNDMEERREVLGRLANIYIAIEGGPGTVHEAQVAHARFAPVIPIGRSGGFANGLYIEMSRPEFADEVE